MDVDRYKWSIIVWLGIRVILFTSLTGLAEEITHVTDIGSFIGLSVKTRTHEGFKYSTKFLGIPFAKPPIGNLRFARPVSFGQFTVPYNATYNRPHCIQTGHMYKYIEAQRFKQDEDCLYLNIYIPGNLTDVGKNVPVMLYIHGGSFASGGGDIYAGDKLSALYNVIIVTINYRLNVFGFLSDGSANSGNFGLWDMKLAIQWVHDNIGEFRGDPKRVTIFGNSAGGAAVLYQAINPSNRGLFQRVIAQSGSCFAFWAIQKNPTQNFNTYISQAGCNFGTSEDIMECLREKPIEELKLKVSDFVPSVDDDFIPEMPKELLKSNSQKAIASMMFFSELDFMNGVTSDDGAFSREYWSNRIALYGVSVGMQQGVPRHFFENSYVPYMLKSILDETTPVLEQSAIHQYTNWYKPNDYTEVRKKLIEFDSDVTFFVPAVLASNGHRNFDDGSASKNSYFYVFDQKPSFAPNPDWLEGATHFMEVPYVFGFPGIMQTKLIKDYFSIDPFQVNENDNLLSSRVMQYWTSFAKTGNPNPQSNSDEKQLPKWPKFTLLSKDYLKISYNMTSESIGSNLAADRVAFWETLIPAIQTCNKSSGASSGIPVTSLCIFVLVDTGTNGKQSGVRETEIRQTGVRQTDVRHNDVRHSGVRQTGDDILVCSACCNETLCNGNLCVLDGATMPLRTSRGPICYSCRQQMDPSSCHEIKQCGLDQECLLMRYESLMGNDLMYKTECISKQTCAERLTFYKTAIASAVIGKRSVGQDHCALKCCDTDLCNSDCTGDRVMYLHNTSISHITLPSSPSSSTTTSTTTAASTVAITTKDPTQTQGQCRDVHAADYCQSYISMCTSIHQPQRDWARKYCQYTCNMCDDTVHADCYDVWSQQDCTYWIYWCSHPSGDNYQTLNNCKKTCNNC
ncbi:type-B carboxylesterase lipase [Mactra antiquata]